LTFVEKAVKRKRVYKGKAVDFWVDTVRLSNGVVAKREYLGHPGAVAIVAVAGGPASNPNILLVKQYRYPVGKVTYELPAGKLSPGENPAPCVHRELEEETGYKAKRIRKVLSYWPTPAFANEIIHIYVAQKLFRGRFNPDEDEMIEPQVMSLHRALRMIRSGAIQDSKTIIGLFAYKLHI
jgi:ADP-ribose pyrophosphatase